MVDQNILLEQRIKLKLYKTNFWYIFKNLLTMLATFRLEATCVSEV